MMIMIIIMIMIKVMIIMIMIHHKKNSSSSPISRLTITKAFILRLAWLTVSGRGATLAYIGNTPPKHYTGFCLGKRTGPSSSYPRR